MTTKLPGTMFIPHKDLDCDMSELKDSTIVTRSTVDGSGGSSYYDSDTYGFSGIGSARSLHGRQEEIAKMKNCFTEVASDGAAQLLLVGGESGSGKSALVEHMREYVTSSDCNGFFCEGKFEQRLLGGATNEPFSALAIAFSDVIDFILNTNGKSLRERSQAVSKALGPDVTVLINFVPNLSLLLGVALSEEEKYFLDSSDPASRDGASTKTASHLPILFRNFLRSLTSKAAPILLFLDDLQFADEDSLDVFRALVTDPSLKHVLVVGAYRSNEISAAQLLGTNATGGPNSASVATLSTTTIHVGDLDLSAINVGLAERLHLEEETTEPLSRVVLQKSGGNPFYVTQYLTVLQEEQLLFYCEDDERWTWDLDDILIMTNVSNNVLELVSQRLQALQDEIKSLLTLIAFIGFRFELGLVEVVLRQLTGMSSTNSKLENQDLLRKAVALLRESKSPTQNLAAIQDVLRRAVKDGLIEKCSSTTFKFTHDRIQQALYGMIEKESAKSELHYYIGHAVLSSELLNGEEKRSRMFFVADQLNRGIKHITEEDELIELSETNLKVGKASASRAAYQSAAIYLRSGMSYLEDPKYWSTHYSLMLDLCSSAAEMEAKISNFDRSREICELVLNRALSLDDKVRAYVCVVSSFCIQERLDDAVRIGLEFLSKVGVKFPRRPTLAHVVANLIQTKKCMYKVSDSMILESPIMPDNKLAKAIEVLNTLATTFYMMENAGDMFAIIVMRSVQLTRHFGLADTTAQGLAFFGLLNSSLGDRKQALRYGNLALALMRSPRLNGKVVEARVVTLVYHFVLSWEMPLNECTNHFIEGVRAGKQQGDLEWGYLSGNGVIGSMVHSGYHLSETLVVSRELCGEMLEFEVDSPARMTIAYWQLVENLTGNSENTHKLTGEAMDEDSMIQRAEQNKNLIALEIIHSIRLCAAVIFQEWDLAAELAPLVVKGIKFLDAHFWGYTIRLYLGLTYSESYLRNGRRKDLRRLLKIWRKVKSYCTVGVDNAKPLLFILEAELAATKRNKQVARKETTKALYKKAVDQCQAQKFIHYAAIANERALRVCQLNQDEAGAVSFMNDAKDCYGDWGADAKVEQMEEIYYRLNVPTKEL